MKKHILVFSLAVAGSLFSACDKQYENVESFPNQEATSTESYYAPAFAEPDKSTKLTGTPYENLKAIFEATGSSIITDLGRMEITDDQFLEIAEFTDNLVKGYSSQMDKYDVIFKWITKNIKYGQSDPNPYAVFINKLCVCQGYANLLTVMCHTQDIPTVVVNGFLNGYGVYGGHAWAYTCPDNTWVVSDPTNGGSWKMSNVGGYTHLFPSEADVDLFADERAIYRYYDYSINVDEVTTTENPLIIPYSAGGFVITSFNPSVDLPEAITDVYVGENITTFGETYNMGLNDHGKSLQAIHVDENNPSLMSHKGVVYRKNGDEAQLYYIPGNMRFIELMPMKIVEKNTIYNHYGVEEIYFPKGTKMIESYAIENCPKLERVYIPDDTEISDDILYNCPSDVEIIRGEPSGIKHVTM